MYVDKVRLFPVMREMKTVAYVPLDLVLAHEKQAFKNHSQSVPRLMERGGLSCCELAAVLEDRAWSRMDDQSAWYSIMKACSYYFSPPGASDADR